MKNPLAPFTIAVTGDFGSSRRHEDIRRWIENNGGKFTSSITSSTTHLICSPEHFRRQVPAVKQAKARNSIKIVSYEWLEDCLQKKACRKETPYLLGKEKVNGKSKGKSKGPSKEPTNALEELAAIRQRRETDIAVPATVCGQAKEELITESYQAYRDVTKFDYDVALVRGDSERLQLQLCESKTAPPTYATFIKQLSSSEGDDTGSTLHILAPPGSSYFDAFREFQKAFLIRTKVHWDDRLEELPRKKDAFIYTPPPIGEPRGLLPGSCMVNSIGNDEETDAIVSVETAI